MRKALLILCAPLVFTGCATVMNDSTHPIKVETKNADGQIVAGAECKGNADQFGLNLACIDHHEASFQTAQATQLCQL